MDEHTVSEEDIRREHLDAVNERVQALYLAGVIIGSLVLMLLLIAWLGAAA